MKFFMIVLYIIITTVTTAAISFCCELFGLYTYSSKEFWINLNLYKYFGILYGPAILFSVFGGFKGREYEYIEMSSSSGVVRGRIDKTPSGQPLFDKVPSGMRTTTFVAVFIFTFVTILCVLLFVPMKTFIVSILGNTNLSQIVPWVVIAVVVISTFLFVRRFIVPKGKITRISFSITISGLLSWAIVLGVSGIPVFFDWLQRTPK